MISSLQNQKIKKVFALQQKQKVRKKEKLYVVEGKKIIDEAPTDLIEEIFISEDFIDNNIEYVNKLSIRHEVVSDKIFKHISTSVSPQGILAVIKQNEYHLEDIDLDNEPFIVGIENIQDPGNIGTIIRTAEAANVTCLILSTGTVDIYNPKVIRATMGSIFRLPIIMNVDIIDTIKRLKEKEINVYAAHLKGEKYYYEVDMKKATCVIIGNEGNGLSKEVSSLATEYVKIPMLGKAESLNASVATSILIYEAVRQRI